jgi:hypothetical protein
MGGDLVKIDSAQENNYVGLLARTIPKHNGGLWIGLVGGKIDIKCRLIRLGIR